MDEVESSLVPLKIGRVDNALDMWDDPHLHLRMTVRRTKNDGEQVTQVL
jgi:hypothetical protein